MDDKDATERPLLVEAAASGRGACGKCGANIEKDTIRVQEVDISDWLKYAGGEGVSRGYGIKRWFVHLACHIPKTKNLPVSTAQYDLKKLKAKLKPDFLKWIETTNAKGVGVDGEYQAPFSKTASAPPPEVGWGDLLPEDKIKYAAFFPQGKAYAAAEAARVKSSSGGKKASNAQKPVKANSASVKDDDSDSDEDDVQDDGLEGLPLKRGKKRSAPAAAPVNEPADESDSKPKRGKRK